MECSADGLGSISQGRSGGIQCIVDQIRNELLAFTHTREELLKPALECCRNASHEQQCTAQSPQEEFFKTSTNIIQYVSLCYLPENFILKKG